MTATFETTKTTPAFVAPALAAGWIDDHGDYLYRFAVSRLHDAVTAEDLVQETFLAAMRSRSSFAERSSVRTWLCGILKHKIADHYRHMFRTPSLVNSVPLDESEALLFKSNGAWSSPEGSEAAFDRAELRARLRAALPSLPKRLAVAFTLREIDGLEPAEICRLLNISPNNLHLLLHRARIRLNDLMTRRSN